MILPTANSVLTLPRLLIAATFFSGCIIAGLFATSFFRALPSIGMIGLFLVAVLSYITSRKSYSRGDFRPYGAFIVVFILHLASGLQIDATNRADYTRDVVLQLPFLVLPLAFWLLPAFPARHLRGLWLWLVATTVLASFYSMGHYLQHLEAVNESYIHSKVMQTEPDHIRFSLLVTLTITAGVALLVHNSIKPVVRPWLLLAVGWLALYQHILAVRSGLMTLYALGGLALLWLIFRKRLYRKATGLALVLLLLPVISYVCFPTFRNKLTNTRKDVKQVDRTTAANDYSLTGRVYSYKAALMVVQDNSLFGVGKANMAGEIAKRYRQRFPSIRPAAYLLPHNQFLYSAVCFGLVGLFFLVAGIYYAGVRIWPRHAPILFAQYVIVTLSFLVEYTLETQVGIAVALFFLLLALEGSKPALQPETEWRPA